MRKIPVEKQEVHFYFLYQQKNKNTRLVLEFWNFSVLKMLVYHLQKRAVHISIPKTRRLKKNFGSSTVMSLCHTYMKRSENVSVGLVSTSTRRGNVEFGTLQTIKPNWWRSRTLTHVSPEVRISFKYVQQKWFSKWMISKNI